MRPRTVWALLAVAVAVVLGVMAAVTWTVLELDDRRLESEREAVVEELVRLSLWRMDSATTLLLSREIAEAGEVPSESLPQGVRARFVAGMQDIDVVAVADPDAREQLRALVAAHAEVLEAMPLDRGELDGLIAGGLPSRSGDEQAVAPKQLAGQELRNAVEYYKRVENVHDNVDAYTSSVRASKGGTRSGAKSRPELEPTTSAPSNERDMMRPMWWGEELVLVRRVVEDGRVRLEGSWIDWPALESALLAEIADLVPDAALVAADGPALDEVDRRLATLPVRLEVATDAIVLPQGAGPLRASLAVGWIFVVLATSAVVVLLRASLALSERRAAFVSAVTHELRTPLTTFRMYTEMLGERMVEDKRDSYVATLRREAVRLGHLVENVLAYARIESDQAVRARERIIVAELVERCADRLLERAEAGGVQLDIDISDAAAEAAVWADRSAIEQILFNLVDNATKYGATEADPCVHLTIEGGDGTVDFHVRDRGPGVPADERRRIFAPFVKGRAHAAGTKPGVGLGLALSRRLAEDSGGRLQLAPADRGADFVLTLPVA